MVGGGENTEDETVARGRLGLLRDIDKGKNNNNDESLGSIMESLHW